MVCSMNVSDHHSHLVLLQSFSEAAAACWLSWIRMTRLLTAESKPRCNAAQDPADRLFNRENKFACNNKKYFKHCLSTNQTQNICCPARNSNSVK